jgi:hypothetical protein
MDADGRNNDGNVTTPTSAANVMSRRRRRCSPSDTRNDVGKVLLSPKVNDFGAIYWVAQKMNKCGMCQLKIVKNNWTNQCGQ